MFNSQFPFHIRLLALGALACIGSASLGPCRATVYTYTLPAVDGNSSLSFPRWDPTQHPGEDLTSVQFGFTVNVFGSVDMQESVWSPGGRMTAAAYAPVFFNDPLGQVFINNPQVTIADVGYSDQPSPPQIHRDFGPLQLTTGSFTVPGLASRSLTDYEGAGNMTFQFVNNGTIIKTSGATGGVSGTLNFDRTVFVTFSAAPEPTSIAVLSLGAGLLLRRRRLR